MEDRQIINSLFSYKVSLNGQFINLLTIAKMSVPSCIIANRVSPFNTFMLPEMVILASKDFTAAKIVTSSGTISKVH